MILKHPSSKKKLHNMTVEKNKILHSEGKKPILYDVYYENSAALKPTVIFCHGYKGFKDWGAWDLVAEAFAKAGFFFLKFNFSHNGGTIEQPIDFPDLEAFAKNNYSLELDDLERVINFVTSGNPYSEQLDKTNISLIGHSRGGGIVLIKAEENPAVKKVISLAGVSDFKKRFQEGSEGFKNWKETGRTFVENGRTKQQMPHDWQFYEDFKANEDRLTIERAVRNLKIPQLIIHGSNDNSVAIEEARKINGWNSGSSFEILSNADHVFGSSHPWPDSELPKDLQKAVDLMIAFITQN